MLGRRTPDPEPHTDTDRTEEDFMVPAKTSNCLNQKFNLNMLKHT